MRLWGCEVMSLWGYEFVSLWVCEVVRLWGYKFVSLWVYEFMSLWVCEFMSLWVCEFVSLWVCEFMSWQVNEPASKLHTARTFCDIMWSSLYKKCYICIYKPFKAGSKRLPPLHFKALYLPLRRFVWHIAQAARHA